MRIRVLILLLGIAAWTGVGAEEVPLRGEFGVRYWVSTGETKHSHSAQAAFPAFGHPTSVLHYDNLDANAIEVHLRQFFEGRWFIKGTLGTGRINTGSFRDEDFFAGQEKFSDTISSVPEGWLSYGTIDIGRSEWVLQEGRHSLGAFIGYGQWTEYVDAYGLTDLMGGSPISRDVKVISNKAIWRMLRLGVNGSFAFGERTRLAADIAAIPYATVRNEDSHHLRTDPNDLGPVPNIIIEGKGAGFQLDVDLRHEVVRRWDLSLGWRYWYLKSTDGERKVRDFMDLPLVELYSRRHGATLSLLRRW